MVFHPEGCMQCLARFRIRLILHSWRMGGGLVCESVGRAEMRSTDFDGKQSMDPVDLPSACHPSPSLTTFAFWSREVRRVLLDHDSYGGTDPWVLHPLFLRRTNDVLSPRLAVVFLRLLRLGSFPVCWRVANVTPIPKGTPASSVVNYRPILTPMYIYCPRVLSFWYRFVFGVFWNAEVCFQPPSWLIANVFHL